MKDFTVTDKLHWVKVTRFADKSFLFAKGFCGDIKAYQTKTVSSEFMVTIKDAKEYAVYLLETA